MPEGAIAVLSQRWARRGRFGNVTEALENLDRNQTLVVAFLTIAFIMYVHFSFMGTSMCMAPRNADGSGGLLSFSAW